MGRSKKYILLLYQLALLLHIVFKKQSLSRVYASDSNLNLCIQSCYSAKQVMFVPLFSDVENLCGNDMNI